MNPLEKFGPNEPCWCGSGRKYKVCHGNHRPASQPGEAVPPDTADGSLAVLLQSLRRDPHPRTWSTYVPPEDITSAMT
jgi:hypothetical protein